MNFHRIVNLCLFLLWTHSAFLRYSFIPNHVNDLSPINLISFKILLQLFHIFTFPTFLLPCLYFIELCCIHQIKKMTCFPSNGTFSQCKYLICFLCFDMYVIQETAHPSHPDAGRSGSLRHGSSPHTHKHLRDE